MSTSYKAFFLPLDDRILYLYKGYVMDGQMLTSKTEADIYIAESGFKKDTFRNAVFEDIPFFLHHCKKMYTRVFLYSFQEPSREQEKQIHYLIVSGMIYGHIIIDHLADLQPIIIKENISVLNSLLVLTDTNEKVGADTSGFTEQPPFINVKLWYQNNKKDFEKKWEWEGKETLLEMSEYINHHLGAKDRLFFRPEYVFFIEEEGDCPANRLIRDHFNKIGDAFGEKGMQLVYFPLSKELLKENRSYTKFLKYTCPSLFSLSDEEIDKILSDAIEFSYTDEFYEIIIKESGLPYFPRPCFLKNVADISPEYKNRFAYYQLSDDDSLEDIIKLIRYSMSMPMRHSISGYGPVLACPAAEPTKPEYDADRFFYRDGKALPKDLKKEIDQLKRAGKYNILAEAILYLLQNMKDENPEWIAKLRPVITRQELLQAPIKLSKLVITNGYRIFLPDYGNQEIKLAPLPKSLYFLFLKHPEGIRFAELFEYKQELLRIYNHVTGRQDEEAIRSSIDRLVDMRQPFINENCSRIRAAFRRIMDEPVAKHYYIDGENGTPRKIVLTHDLLDMQCGLHL